MHFISRRHHNLMRHLLLIEGGEPQGGAGEPPAGQNTNGEGDNAKNTTTDNAKEFSHALAARVEEEKAKLEAKYAGYDEYKAKAAKYDANESGNAAKLEAADKKIEALTKEITTLKATAERETLIGQLAKDTGLGREGYSIIGQGKIDEILSAKSGERREVFEEDCPPRPPAQRPPQPPAT